MDAKYRTEIAKLVARGLGWMIEETPIRDTKLSPNEIVKLVSRDCARGANGLPVMYSVPTRTSKKIKL